MRDTMNIRVKQFILIILSLKGLCFTMVEATE
jgi:hypothetical protein